MNARIYILAGGSCSGKTTLLNLIEETDLLNAVILQKYSDRKERDGNDDVTHVDDIKNGDYSFVYYMQDNFYGFKLNEIIEPLKNGKNVFLIISDIRVIEEIRNYFGEFVSVLYLFRNMSDDEFETYMKMREKGSKEKEDNSKQIRKNRLYLIQRQYIENISLFDYVILNRKKESEKMLLQVKNITDGYINYGTKPHKGPVIFLIAAASGAGKKTLMEAMYSLGSKSINVIKKETDRDQQPGDGPEIIAGVKNVKGKYIINYSFGNNNYAIDDKIIWDNLKTGLPQIIITNMQQFHKFREIFGNSTVNIYLHATRTSKELYEHQLQKLNGDRNKAELKIKKVEQIHQDYIKNISLFHHVLLNTIKKEDLWDQMFKLIQYYKK